MLAWWFLLSLSVTNAQTAGSIPPLSVTSGASGSGEYLTVTIPGQVELRINDGRFERGGTEEHGLTGLWDLKNDPERRYNFGAMDTGIHEYQYALVNRMLQTETTRNQGLLKRNGSVVVRTVADHYFRLGDEIVVTGAGPFNESPGYESRVTQVLDSRTVLYTPRAAAGVADGTTGSGRVASSRHFEYKSGPANPSYGGSMTLLEHNNVRVRIRYHHRLVRYGKPEYQTTGDCCVTQDEYYSIYRPGKVYVVSNWNYDGSDGKGPLSMMSLQVIPKITWFRSGVGNVCDGFDDCAASPCQYGTPTPDPFMSPWQGNDFPNTYNKSWILYTADPSAANAPAPIPVRCRGRTIAPTGGDVSVCATHRCPEDPPRISGHIRVRLNMLTVVAETPGTYQHLDQPNFLGKRARMFVPGCEGCMGAGAEVFKEVSAQWIGDNGITTVAAADSYATEYRQPPVMKMHTGSGGTFDRERGAWQMNAGGNVVAFTTTGQLHDPAFEIAAWQAGVPSVIKSDGTVMQRNLDYVSDKAPGDRLLLQLVGTQRPGQLITISGLNSE